MQKNNELNNWLDIMADITLPRWEQLPDIDLYMVQVLQLMEKYLNPLFSFKDEKILTKSMINNYVKLQLIPPPVKKQYTKRHVAYLMAITILKQILPISDLKIGLVKSIETHGEKKAYNTFVESLERAIQSCALTYKNKENLNMMMENYDDSLVVVRFAVISLSTKIITQKIIEEKYSD